MPGVRVSMSSRGVRAGLGPRAARVHVGSGRPAVSTGVGPFTAWSAVGGGSRPRQRAPSMAAYERQVRATERQEELEHWAELNRQLIALGSAHLDHFPPAEPRLAPP